MSQKNNLFDPGGKQSLTLLAEMKQYEDQIAVSIAEKNQRQEEWIAILEKTRQQINLIGTSAETMRESILGAVEIAPMAEFGNAWEEYLAKYEAFMQKREAITKSYQEKIASTTSEGEKVTLQEELKKVLANLETQIAPELAEPLGEVLKGMESKVPSELRQAARQGRKTIEFVEQGEWDEDKGAQLGISQKAFNSLSTDTSQLEGAKKQIDEVSKKADKAGGAFQQMGSGFKKVFTSGNDTQKLQEGIGQIEAGAKQASETAEFLGSTFSGLGDSFDSEGLKGIGDAFGVVQKTMDGISKGAKAGAMFGPIGAAAGAALGAVSSLLSSIAALHDAKNEKRIKSMQVEIDDLEKGYKKLEKNRTKSYSDDAQGVIAEQNASLERQKSLINQQIAEEEDKKKTNDDRIKGWKDKIDEINNTLEENQIKMQDAIFGSNVQDAITNFAQAYSNAWAAGEDRSKASKDMVKNMIRQMVVEAMKADIANPMQTIRNKLEEFWKDGEISESEQALIEAEAEKLNKQLNSTFGWADRFLTDEKDPERQGASKGIATASQESVDMLGGLMTSVQGHTYAINESVKTLTTNSTAILNHLSGIESNTGGSLDKLGAIENSLASVKADINNLVVKGITLR